MNVITQTHYKSQLTITQMTPILDEVNMDLRRMEEEWNIMEQETSQSETNVNNDHELVRRRVIRAIHDSKRLFWEENFQHCLCFERKHVYQAFMTREGRWYNQHANESSTRRIPRSLIGSLDQPVQHANGESWEMDIVDEQAQQALLSVEQHDLPRLILNLPEKLKPVIWLIFWEGRTEKYVANILGVSDRTVRNRLHKALNMLRTVIEMEGKTIHG